MSDQSKLYETLITISVLCTEKPYEFSTYDQLAYDVIEGDCSGFVVREDSQPLAPDEFAQRCATHGTDPGFFGLDGLEEE